MQCINCGEECSETAQICIYCGAMLPKKQNTESTTSPEMLVRGKKRRKKNKVLITLLFLTPLFALLLILIFLFILGSID